MAFFGKNKVTSKETVAVDKEDLFILYKSYLEGGITQQVGKLLAKYKISLNDYIEWDEKNVLRI